MSRAGRRLKRLDVPEFLAPRLQPVRWSADQAERACRRCGCTENDCSTCINRTGMPCHWVERDLCSACRPSLEARVLDLHLLMQARTPGEWRAVNASETVQLVASTWDENGEQHLPVASDVMVPDARLIARGMMILPELLAAYELQREELRELRSARAEVTCDR